MSNENKDSKIRKMIKQGCIAEYYTLDGYFVKIYPVIRLDKVKFAFVKKGEQGTGFDIYVDMAKFLRLTKNILSGRLAKLIAEDKGSYPSAWKYKSGNDGSKTLAIGKSKSGTPLINGSVKDEKGNKYAMVPLQSYEDLEVMAELFMICTGYTPVTGYWAEIKKIFEEAQKNNQKYYQNDDVDEAPVPNPTNKSEQVPVERTDEHTNDTSSVTSEKAGNKEQWGRFVPVAYGEMKTGFAVKTKDGGAVIFNPNVYKNTENQRVEQIRKMLSSGKMADFTCTYVESKDKKYFLKFA